MSNLWGREPVRVTAVVMAAVALAVGFGLPISAEQGALIHTFTVAVMALVVRERVTPTR